MLTGCITRYEEKKFWYCTAHHCPMLKPSKYKLPASQHKTSFAEPSHSLAMTSPYESEPKFTREEIFFFDASHCM